METMNPATDLLSSPESVENYEDFISSLDPEEAQIIQEDTELVSMMRTDSYWTGSDVDENRGSKKIRAAAVTLPLTNLGNGKYWTINGSKCTCHGSCSPTAFTGSTVTTKDRCYTSVSTTGNCKRYTGTGAIQCKGFADYVFKQYTGSDVGSTNLVSKSSFAITNNSAGQTTLKNFISKLTVGSNLRFAVRDKSYNHSMIITSIATDKIGIYDCNGTANACEIRTTTMTWATLASKYSKMVSAWKA